LLKARIKQLFFYLQALVQQKYPAVRQLSEQPFFMHLSELPTHEAVIYTPQGDYGTPLLEVRRPRLIPCPKPSPDITPWLNAGWEKASQDVSVCEKMPTGNQDENGDEIYEEFSSDGERVRLFEEWKLKRTTWAEERLRAEAAQRIFELLYEQLAYLEKEGGQVELAVADGFLNWRVSSGGISHPLISKRVELIFDEKIPAFRVVDTNKPTELYNSLLMAIEEVDIRRIQERTKELKETQYHPLGDIDTSTFLKAVVQSVSPTNGMFLDSNPHDGEKDYPRMWRQPVFLARKRTTAYSTAIEQILNDIEAKTEFPQSLAAITGLHDQGTRSKSSDVVIPELDAQSREIDISQILLAKEANGDQIGIIRRLAESGRVHVQGPPGTGKTHTIGNIIGHLLAQGKRILVTSHTEKALRVLKSQVPPELQSLCVPVLSGDSEIRRQLENSINAINQRLTRDDPEELLGTARSRFTERETLLQEEKQLKARLRHILDAEYNTFEIDGRQIEPSAAAREVAKTSAGNDWIPGICSLADPLPLSTTEFIELYDTNHQINATEELDLEEGIPDQASIPTTESVEALIYEYRQLLGKRLDEHQDFWKPGRDDYKELEDAANNLLAEFADELLTLAWRPAAIVAGINGGQHRKLWSMLCDRIDRAVEYSQKLSAFAYLGPTIPDDADIETVIDVLAQIKVHLQEGKSLSAVTLLLKPQWKKVLQTIKVGAGKPHRLEHCEALLLSANLRELRLHIQHLWNDLVASNGGTRFEDLGDKPELKCSAIVEEIRRSLTWHVQVWQPLVNQLIDHGLDWSKVERRVPKQLSPLADFLQIQTIVAEPHYLQPILVSELNRRRMKCVESTLDRIAEMFNGGKLDQKFHGAIIAKDITQYKQCYSRLTHLRPLKPVFEKRKRLVTKLEARNAEWARVIRCRQSPHHTNSLPGDLAKAWRWKRLDCELNKRGTDSAPEIQDRLEKVQERIRATTAELIESLAWGRQVRLVRERPQLQQSLIGWLDLQKRLASVRNKTIQAKMAGAAQLALVESSAAVPVWIMPLQAVAEGFDTSQTRFDVVIIDEASQANLMALIPLYMANEAIIVGDHEQTSPEAVGIQQVPIQNLIDVHLQGIPHSNLFDMLTSIYDLAKRSFGNSLMLTEHFRCVPDIIGFSNKLSYDYKIKPLREAATSTLSPPTVAYRVKGVCLRKRNEIEADTISRLLEAMTEHGAYENKTIGVITLLGEEQAKLIDSKVRARIGAAEYLKRRVVCGTPPQFQGDERDVIFLSLVDSLGEEDEQEFMSRRGEGAYGTTKKRFNVAASRAKDQLWVVHSMDPDVNLKPGDIRRELIYFAKNPRLYVTESEKDDRRTESLFEQLVLKELTDNGYRVIPQWTVGYHRIDMVVIGERDRLAIECDGDRYHGADKRDQDLERQAVLERLGWRFARIRGTSFFRDPKSAMGPVYEKLDRLGIEKLGAHQEPPDSAADMTIVNDLERLAFPEQFESEDVISEEPSSQEPGIDRHEEVKGQAIAGKSYSPTAGKDDHVMFMIARDHNKQLTRDELIKKAIYNLGYKRAGNLLTARLGRAFAKLKKKDLIEVDGNGIVHVKNDPSCSSGLFS
jgi:very-short-patch-repair endonuclease